MYICKKKGWNLFKKNPIPCEMKVNVVVWWKCSIVWQFPLLARITFPSSVSDWDRELKHSLALQFWGHLAAGLHKCVDDLTSHILFCVALTLGRESEFLTTKIAAFPALYREMQTWKHTQRLFKDLNISMSGAICTFFATSEWYIHVILHYGMVLK